MRTLLYICTFILGVSITTTAQINYRDTTQNFNRYVVQTNSYLDSMRTVINDDTVFYAEGGQYAAFQRYYSTNAPLLSGHGSFATYSQQLHNYYLAHPLNNGLSNRSTQANNDAWEELGPKRAAMYSNITDYYGRSQNSVSSNIGLLVILATLPIIF